VWSSRAGMLACAAQPQQQLPGPAFGRKGVVCSQIAWVMSVMPFELPQHRAGCCAIGLWSAGCCSLHACACCVLWEAVV
jgi:hypothetical protein